LSLINYRFTIWLSLVAASYTLKKQTQKVNYNGFMANCSPYCPTIHCPIFQAPKIYILYLLDFHKSLISHIHSYLSGWFFFVMTCWCRLYWTPNIGADWKPLSRAWMDLHVNSRRSSGFTWKPKMYSPLWTINGSLGTSTVWGPLFYFFQISFCFCHQTCTCGGEMQYRAKSGKNYGIWRCIRKKLQCNPKQKAI
jgi:hypothetical protein